MTSQPDVQSKKLVICCDGTWDNSDNGWVKDSLFDNGHLQNPSNVTHLSRAVLPLHDDGTPQVIYYQAGIGSTAVTWTDHIVAGVTGAGISENIREAYAFIVNNYVPGDSIFITGFSRGAFTARSVAGMIGGIGLLTKNGLANFYSIFADYENAGQRSYKPKLPQLLPLFQLGVNPGEPNSYLDNYRANLLHLGLTRTVKVTAIGVWDTVGALGIPVVPVLQRVFGRTSFQEYQFYDTRLGNHVDYAFQALALDEQRPAFTPTLWERQEGTTTKLKQVWFAGAHGNVGGSADNEDTSQADLSLAWMMSCLSPWLTFDRDYLASHVKANRTIYYPAASPSSKFASVPPPRYSCGPLENSSDGFWSLFGTSVRTPGTYYEKAYASGKDLSTALQNTNEFIHASVRARVTFGGLGAEVKTPYKSKALASWSLPNADESHTERTDSGAGVESVTVNWMYHGKEKKAKGKFLPEDELGSFERQLLKLVDPAAERDLFGVEH